MAKSPYSQCFFWKHLHHMASSPGCCIQRDTFHHSLLVFPYSFLRHGRNGTGSRHLGFFDTLVDFQGVHSVTKSSRGDVEKVVGILHVPVVCPLWQELDRLLSEPWGRRPSCNPGFRWDKPAERVWSHRRLGWV